MKERAKTKREEQDNSIFVNFPLHRSATKGLFQRHTIGSYSLVFASENVLNEIFVSFKVSEIPKYFLRNVSFYVYSRDVFLTIKSTLRLRAAIGSSDKDWIVSKL